LKDPEYLSGMSRQNSRFDELFGEKHLDSFMRLRIFPPEHKECPRSGEYGVIAPVRRGFIGGGFEQGLRVP